MKAVLLDDELIQLKGLKTKLEKDFSGIDVVGAFDDPYELLDNIGALDPEVVFLDIHLPGIQGIEVATIIQERSPHIDIIFITGYDQYAIQAFELFAFDYILKPIQSKRLEKTIDRLMEKQNSSISETAKRIPKLTISCFGSLHLYNGEGTEIPIKWRTSKALELFAYFVHHHGKVIERETLLDLFWPEQDEARSSQQLYTTIYHIRKVLKTEKIDSVHLVHSKEYYGGYILQTDESVVYATEEWEKELQSYLSIDKGNAEKHESLLCQYKGDYYAAYDFNWAEAEQERLRKCWFYHVSRMYGYYIQENQPTQAVHWLKRLQEKHPYEEEVHFRLMKLYAELDQRFLVEEQFRNLIEKMDDLGVKPAFEITAWLDQWQKQQIKKKVPIYQ